MVGFAPRRRHGAVRESTSLVSGVERLADVRREDPAGAANSEDLAFGAEQDREDVGVAGNFPDDVRVDGPLES